MTARIAKNETNETMMYFIMLFCETTYETVTRPHETGGLTGLSWSYKWSHPKSLILKDGLIGLLVSITRPYSEEIHSEKSLTKVAQPRQWRTFSGGTCSEKGYGPGASARQSKRRNTGLSTQQMDNEQVNMLELNISTCQKLTMTTEPTSSSIYWKNMGLVTRSICCWLLIVKLVASMRYLAVASW